jgi:HAD superfamily hydrolase (TIGR01549 family)
MTKPLAMGVSNLKAVLFDLGGTLHYYRREEVFRAVLKEKGIEVGIDEVVKAYDATDPIFARLTAELPQEVMWPDRLLERMDLMMLKEIGITDDCENLARYIRQNWDRVDRQHPQNLVRCAYSDAPPCLEAIRKLGLKMGIVSNIPSEERLRKELEAIGLIHFFPVLIASGSVGIAKPKEQIFHLAAKEINETPGNILFVGDDLHRDYYGAIKAGMKAVLIDRRGNLKDNTNVCRLSSLEQLPPILEQSTL